MNPSQGRHLKSDVTPCSGRSFRKPDVIPRLGGWVHAGMTTPRIVGTPESFNPNPKPSRVDFCLRRADNNFMFRIVVTFLFTAVSLIGPSTCCCFANSDSAKSPTVFVATPHPSTPTKSCCESSAPRSDDHNNSKRDLPKKCPCDHGQKSLNQSGLDATSVGDETLSHSKCLDASLEFHRIGDSRTPTNSVGRAQRSRSPVRLAGRSLLVVYSILRC